MTRRAHVTRSGRLHIAMLTRLPEPGRVKTRLVPALGAEGGAALHRALTEHTARTVCLLAATGEATLDVWHDGGSRRRMRAWLGPLPRYRRQPRGDLGRRLAAAFRCAFREGAERCVAVGSDCPAMTAGHLRAAFDLLERRDLVFGPATDGGYWLVGLRRHVASSALPALFSAMPWGGAEVLRESLARAGALPLSVAQLEQLSDVDRPPDLVEWDRVRASSSSRLGLSVVIPTYDEERSVAAVVERVLEGGAQEVIVADGGSVDGTRSVARAAGAVVVEGARGRARQMNAGAACARGGALLFLHADTMPPPGVAVLVEEALSRPGVVAGAFTYAAVGAGRWDPVITAGNRLRYGWSGHPYGDQGLFLRAATFHGLGGFPCLPVMEDWELVRRLRRLGRVVVLPEPARTASSSFAGVGIASAALLNLTAIVGYQLGVDPHRLARWRNRIARRAGPAGS